MSATRKAAEVWQCEDFRGMTDSEVLGFWIQMGADGVPMPEYKQYAVWIDDFNRLGRDEIVRRLAGMEINK